MILASVHFDWHTFTQYLLPPDGPTWTALWTTVYIAVIAQTFGVLFGLVSALAQLSRSRVLTGLSGIYVWFFRGTPVIVQIFFAYFGANLFLGFDLFPRTVGIGPIQVSGAIAAGTVALAFNEGAYMSEIIRAGIRAVDTGQMEAAKSIGMPPALAMRRIVLPQAARIIVPPLGNEFNNMLKTTSLLAFIGVRELFQDADIRYSSSFKASEYFLGVAMLYLLLTTIWTLIQVQIERRLGASDRPEDEKWTARLLGIGTTPAAGVR
jgi:polar amino acid transport system permease protein